MRTYRRIYEINTRVWLRELVAQGRMRHPNLADIPALYLETWQGWHMDAVWLMGVWEPSPYSAQVARAHPGLSTSFQQALPDYTPDDCIGSPYAVRRYEVSELLGGLDGLSAFRARLHQAGIGLILDFVPNHTACDHPWVREHPEYYVQGHADDVARLPGAYFRAHTVHGVTDIAHGRDPYFPPWTDTAQLNYAHAAVHDAMRAELLRIARWCDGVRCDMAMLCLPEVFTRTWQRASIPPPREFWPEVIQAVQQQVPDFCFIAEVYWQLDSRLQQLGFSLTYDKVFYDALMAADTAKLHALLAHARVPLEAALRFLENHDEAPAASRLHPAQEEAAALAILTLPGCVLLHDGQIEGRRYQVPVQLRRRRPEPVQPLLKSVYERLFALPGMQDGTFRFLHPREAWKGNDSFRNVFAWAWQHDQQQWLVVINYADHAAQCRLDPTDLPLPPGDLHFKDLWRGGDYHRKHTDLHQQGLLIELPPFGSHVFEMT